MLNKNKISIKSSTLNDIPILVSHYHSMFKEICVLQNIRINPTELKEMNKNYTAKLRRELKNGTCKAWLIKNDDEILASGAISIISMVPVPNDSFYKVAYLHGLFTERKERKKGYASQIIKEAINYCNKKGIKRLILNSSDDGKSMYLKNGFQYVDNSMRLWVK